MIGDCSDIYEYSDDYEQENTHQTINFQSPHSYQDEEEPEDSDISERSHENQEQESYEITRKQNDFLSSLLGNDMNSNHVFFHSL